MEEIKTTNPAKIIIGKFYMINYIGWKEIKVLEVKKQKVLVQSSCGKGVPFLVDKNRIKVNLININNIELLCG